MDTRQYLFINMQLQPSQKIDKARPSDICVATMASMEKDVYLPMGMCMHVQGQLDRYKRADEIIASTLTLT